MKAKPIFTPSRQAAYSDIHRRNWERLKGADFDGEPVAIRDDSGKPLIRRRSRKAIREMARDISRKELRELSKRMKA